MQIQAQSDARITADKYPKIQNKNNYLAFNYIDNDNNQKILTVQI